MAMKINPAGLDSGGNKKKDYVAEAQAARQNAINSSLAAANAAKTAAVTEAEQQKETPAAAVQNEVKRPAAVVSSGGGSSSSSSKKKYDTTVPTVFTDTTDPELLAQYQNAMSALEQMKGQAPTYGNQYDAQIQDLYQQIVGRGPFKYDQKTDPLYQQYVQDYTTQGKMAMRDTMGRAAGLTGGYGSSYAQAVGQQQYDQYLQKMADILPETYGMALNAYNAEGDQLSEKLATTTDLERSDYNRYLDALNQHNVDVQRAQTDADTWYDRMVAAEKQAYNRQLDQYDMQKDNYNRLIQLISMGYKPSKKDYNAAGLSEAQGEALRGTYMPKAQTVYVRTGGTTPTASTGDTGTASKYNISDFTKAYSSSKTQAEKDEVYKAAMSDVKAGLTNFTLDDLKYARGHS